MAYATLVEARAAGITSGTDNEVTAALDTASRFIDLFCDQTFSGQVTETRTFHDCRQRILPMPTPFTNVTAVVVSSFALTVGQWAVTDYGLELFPVVFKDASGIPMLNTFDFDLAGPYAVYGQSGFEIDVTATWGWPSVPFEVHQACLLLTSDFLNASQKIGFGVDSAVRSLSVEAFSITLADPTLTITTTTGNVMADRWLYPFRKGSAIIL